MISSRVWQCLSDTLLDFGTRVQESVFQCLPEPELDAEMIVRNRRTIEENSDKVYIVSVCDGCAARVVTYCLARVAAGPEFLII